MLSAHISSRMLSLFISSYPPHRKKKKHISKEMKATEGGKIRGVLPLFLINCRQWEEPINKSLTVSLWAGVGALQLRVECVWAADIKHYWIFPKTWTARIWNLIQLMKAVLKIGVGGWRWRWRCGTVEGGWCWNEPGFIGSPKHFHGKKKSEKANVVLKRKSKKIARLRQERDLKIHFWFPFLK